MKKKYQTSKRKIKKQIKYFFERLFFIGKMTIVVFILFIAILFMMTKPNRMNLESIFSDKSEVADVSEILSKQDFIDVITPIALQANKDYGIRPSVLVAQAALESNWGKSQLSKESNNYFGIKGSTNAQNYATKEFTNNKWQKVQASFRTYSSLEESIYDYANLIKNGTSWNADLYQGVISANHYKEAAKAIQNAGYATDPNYANKLIGIIEQYDLQELDN